MQLQNGRESVRELASEGRGRERQTEREKEEGRERERVHDRG